MRPARRPAVLEGWVFRSRNVMTDGVLTPGRLRSSAWRRLHRGVHADARLPVDVGLRIRGASLVAPVSAVLTGRTAAWLHGATERADARSPVELTVPAGTSFGPVAGLRIRHADLDPGDVTTVAGRRSTTELATAPAIAADEQPVTSVAALDVLLRRGPVNGRELVGLPDLRVAIEYDGAWHGDAPQLTRDRRRMNDLQAAGWRVLFVTAADMRDPAVVVAKVRAFLASASSGIPS